MKLYYTPNTGRPVRVAWLLEEIGAPYEVVPVTREQRRGAEHLKRQPLGRVPAVELDDGRTLFDSTALVLHLADLHPDAGILAAPGSIERGLAYQWSLTAITELEPAAVAYVRRDERTDQGAGPRARFAEVAGVFSDALAGRQFLIGERLSVADIVLGGTVGVAYYAQLMPDAAPGLVDYYRALAARPAFARALERTESLLRG